MVDPLPPDATEDSSEEDALPDVMVADPPPPDILETDPGIEDAEDGADAEEDVKPDIPLPMDPLPPDVQESPETSELSPPAQSPALPLDRSFRVALEASQVPGGVRLEARTARCAAAELTWRCGGGTLEVDGDTAIFRPDGREAPWVAVIARQGSSKLDVARHLPT